MTLVSLMNLTQILAITMIFVSGLYMATYPALGISGLALGTGWLSILNASLLRLIRKG